MRGGGDEGEEAPDWILTKVPGDVCQKMTDALVQTRVGRRRERTGVIW